jgi:hypothetical protein
MSKKKVVSKAQSRAATSIAAPVASTWTIQEWAIIARWGDHVMSELEAKSEEGTLTEEEVRFYEQAELVMNKLTRLIEKAVR